MINNLSNFMKFMIFGILEIFSAMALAARVSGRLKKIRAQINYKPIAAAIL
jgi:hypothetical protein